MPPIAVNQRTARLGFIGLGLMGSRLTRRLHLAGWDIQAWNRSPRRMDWLGREGIAMAGTVTSLVAQSDVILSSLANDQAVRSVYLDKGGVIATAEPGTIILEMSTISPELSRLMHREADKRGINLLDVAISGSTPAVEAGTVTLLAGGNRGTFDLCTSVFRSIAKQWFLIGPASYGVQMKLVMNLLVGLDMQAISEAVSLGEHLQINRNILLDVLSKTTATPPAILGKIKNGGYSPEFPLQLMSRDIDLAMNAARNSGADLPAARVAQSVLSSRVSAIGDVDLAAIAPYVTGKRTRAKV